MNLSDTLGFRYDSLEEAKGFVRPGQLVVTDNDETFYLVKQETLMQGLFQLGYVAINF